MANLLPPDQIPSLYRSLEEIFSANDALEAKVRSISPFSIDNHAAKREATPLVDFTKLDALLKPLDSFRPTVASGGPSPPASFPTVSKNVHENIVKQVISSQLESLRKEHDAEVKSRLDSMWNSMRSEILREFTPSSSSSSVVSIPPTGTSDNKGETPKMSLFYSATFETRAGGGYKATSGLNLEVMEMWTLVEDYFAQADSLSTLIQRCKLGRLFLERQFRHLICQKMNISPSSSGEDFARSVSHLPNLSYLLFRSGEYEMGLRSLEHDSRLQAHLDSFYKSDSDAPFSNANPAHILENLWNGQFQVSTSVEDFLWQRLGAFRHSESKLRELGMEIFACGPNHFSQTDPFRFTRILLTCGQIERAVNYLLSVSMEEGVHVAVSLRRHQSALRKGVDDAMDKSVVVVNVEEVCAMYASKFVNPVKAMSYLTLNGSAPQGSKSLLIRNAHQCASLFRVLKKSKVEKVLSLLQEAAQEVKDAKQAAHLYVEYLHEFPEDKDLVLKDFLQVVQRELCSVLSSSSSSSVLSENAKFWKQEAELWFTPRPQSLIQILSCVQFYELVEHGEEDACSKTLSWLFPEEFRAMDFCVHNFATLDSCLMGAFPQLVRVVMATIVRAFQLPEKRSRAQKRLKILISFVARLSEDDSTHYTLRSDVEKELLVLESRLGVVLNDSDEEEEDSSAISNVIPEAATVATPVVLSTEDVEVDAGTWNVRTKKNGNSARMPRPDCFICLLPASRDSSLSNPCSCNAAVVVHAVCLKAWYAKSLTCPLCRAEGIPPPCATCTTPAGEDDDDDEFDSSTPHAKYRHQGSKPNTFKAVKKREYAMAKRDNQRRQGNGA